MDAYVLFSCPLFGGTKQGAAVTAAAPQAQGICPHQLTVTVASSPSGTLATMMPMRKITASSQVYSRISERTKKETPRKTATPVIIWIKCSISTAMGVRPPSSPEARVAIRPITVRSPVLMTTPRAVPGEGDKQLLFANCVNNSLSYCKHTSM